MNPLFKKQTMRPSLAEFAKSITPDQAKQRLDQMLAKGEITQAQIRQAESIARSMGLTK